MNAASGHIKSVRHRPFSSGLVLLICFWLKWMEGATALGQTVLWAEDFEGAFPGNWSAFDADPNSGNAHWGVVDAAFGGEGAVSGNGKAYCAGVGYWGTAELPLYPDSMGSTLRRTFDLAGYTHAILRFFYKIPSVETGFDDCRIIFSGPGTNELVWLRDTPVTAWTRQVFNLDRFAGLSREVTFLCTSDVSLSREGWYLDDIVVLVGNGPANDFFDAPLRLNGSQGSYTGMSVDAGKEPGEPNHVGNPGGASIWFSWTAPDSQPMKFATLDNTMDSIMAVYQGDRIGNLTLVGENDDTEPGYILTSTVQFQALANQTYLIAVDGYDGDAGEVKLIWEPIVDPPTVVSVSTRGNPNQVAVTWSEPVSAGSGVVAANYQIEGASVFLASFGATSNVVLLSTSTLDPDQSYVLTVANVRDNQQNLLFPTPTVVGFAHGQEYPAFQILKQRYNVGPGSFLADFTNNPAFPNSPNDLFSLASFEQPAVNGANDGIRICGTYLPPVTGSYRFYISSASQGIAYIARDGVPVRKEILALEPLWSEVRDYTGVDQRNPNNPENRSDLITLQAGQPIFLEALVKEDSGLGHLSLAVQLPESPDPPTSPISGADFLPMRYHQGTMFFTLGPVSLLAQPQATTGYEGGTALFDAGIDGTPPYLLQWRRNGVAIPGATNLVLHYGPLALAEDGSQFTLSVSNHFSGVISKQARLTVQPWVSTPFELGYERSGGHGVRLLAPPGAMGSNAFLIQASTNLVHWQAIWTNTPPDSMDTFVDPSASNYTRRFYRVIDAGP